LVNENVIFTKQNRTINIIGIDDFLQGTPDFTTATKTINDKTLETIVLNHCPVYSETIRDLNKSIKISIKIILSGHTHGGQITFFGLEIYKPTGSGRYLRGWYNLENIKIYVSKGIGTTILPLRFFARAEASIFYI